MAHKVMVSVKQGDAHRERTEHGAWCPRRACKVVAATAVVRTVFLVVYQIQKPLLSHAHVSHKGQSGYSRHRGQEEGQRKRVQTHSLWPGWGQKGGGQPSLAGSESLGVFGDAPPHCLISDPQPLASDSRSAPWSPQHRRRSINVSERTYDVLGWL